MARCWCRRVPLLLFTVQFLLLLSFVFFSQNRVYTSESLMNKNSEYYKLPVRNFADNYTQYTVNRLGLKELEDVAPLEPEFGPVFNDVTSFEYAINKESVCQQFGNANRTLLVVIVSAAKNFVKRETIRRTWARTLNESTYFGDQWAKFAFLVGSTDSETQRKVFDESQVHSDVIHVKLIDQYANLSQKTVALLHWTMNYCSNAHFILKCDDDVFVNVQRLSEIISQIDSLKDLYGSGKTHDEPKRFKLNKYYVSEEVWPWSTYPGYLFGGAYLVGRDAVRLLLAAAQTTPYFIFEDVYITGICTKRTIVNIYVSEFMYRQEFPEKVDACSAQNFAMWMTDTTDQIFQLNEVVQRIARKEVKCMYKCNRFNVCTMIEYSLNVK